MDGRTRASRPGGSSTAPQKFRAQLLRGGTSQSLSRALVALALSAVFSGCPGPLPPPPSVGTDCQTVVECNPGRTCGALTPCVVGRCARDASVAVACDGYDTPVGGAPDAGG